MPEHFTPKRWNLILFLIFGVERFRTRGFSPRFGSSLRKQCPCLARPGTLLAELRVMIPSLHSKIVFFWVALFSIFGCLRSAPAALPALEKPYRVEFQGRSYEILKDPNLKLVKVTTGNSMGPIRDELILKIRREHLPPRHIHLRLSSTTPESMVYTGILPSRILWRGSLTFELAKSSR